MLAPSQAHAGRPSGLDQPLPVGFPQTVNPQRRSSGAPTCGGVWLVGIGLSQGLSSPRPSA